MSSLEGWNFGSTPVVRETHLSRKPAKASLEVALASVVVLAAASMMYWTDAFGLATLFPASRESVFGRGEYWRLLTSLFTHADVEHLLSNGIVFGLLAFLLFGYYGPRVYPGAVLGLAAIVTGVSLLTYPPSTILVGASGAVYLMTAFWLVLYLLIERGTGAKKRFVRAVGFALITLLPASYEPGVSYRTHAIGFAFGLVSGLLYFWQSKDVLRRAERIEVASEMGPLEH
jgi:membrane associated rhomboid family serine protease